MQYLGIAMAKSVHLQGGVAAEATKGERAPGDIPLQDSSASPAYIQREESHCVWSENRGWFSQEGDSDIGNHEGWGRSFRYSSLGLVGFLALASVPRWHLVN